MITSAQHHLLNKLIDAGLVKARGWMDGRTLRSLVRRGLIVRGEVRWDNDLRPAQYDAWQEGVVYMITEDGWNAWDNANAVYGFIQR